MSQKVRLVISDVLHVCSALRTQGKFLENPMLDQKLPQLLGNPLLEGKIDRVIIYGIFIVTKPLTIYIK